MGRRPNTTTSNEPKLARRLCRENDRRTSRVFSQRRMRMSIARPAPGAASRAPGAAEGTRLLFSNNLLGPEPRERPLVIAALAHEAEEQLLEVARGPSC